MYYCKDGAIKMRIKYRKEIREMYNKFIKINGNVYPDSDENPWDNIDKKYHELNINLNLKDIKKAYAKYGIIQLRKIDNKANLVIGCGNGPLVDGGGYPITNLTKNDYHKQHKHEDAITINPDIGSNSTVIGFFGQQNISKFFKDINKKFDKITIEGVALLQKIMMGESTLTLKELHNLLSDKGVINYCNMIKLNKKTIKNMINDKNLVYKFWDKMDDLEDEIKKAYEQGNTEKKPMQFFQFMLSKDKSKNKFTPPNKDQKNKDISKLTIKL